MLPTCKAKLPSFAKSSILQTQCKENAFQKSQKKKCLL